MHRWISAPPRSTRTLGVVANDAVEGRRCGDGGEGDNERHRRSGRDPRSCGTGSRSCFPSRNFGRPVGARGRRRVGFSTVSSTSCARAVSGRRSHGNMERVPRCTGDSSGGSSWASGKRSGAGSYSTTIESSGSRGSGSPPMRRCTKPRWAGKKTGPNPTDRAKGGTKRHHLTDRQIVGQPRHERTSGERISGAAAEAGLCAGARAGEVEGGRDARHVDVARWSDREGDRLVVAAAAERGRLEQRVDHDR